MIKRKKTLLTAIIFLFSLLCFAIGSVCLKPASADTSFVMESGAYVRVVTGESGIRFRARVSKPNENETREYRMLIVPEKLLTDKNIQEKECERYDRIRKNESADPGGGEDLR